MPERLLEAVQGLAAEVKSLHEDLEKNYPKRSEIEDNYEDKKTLRKKRFSFVIFGLIIVLVSQFLTVSMISYCFLGDQTNNHHAACSVLPGYDNTQARSAELLATFTELVDFIHENRGKILTTQDELTKLKLEVGTLEERVQKLQDQKVQLNR